MISTARSRSPRRTLDRPHPKIWPRPLVTPGAEDGLKGSRPSRPSATKNRLWLCLSLILFATLLLPTSSCAADIIFIRAASGSQSEQQALQVATEYYGVKLKVLRTGSSPADKTALRDAIEQNNTLAIVIAANALPNLNKGEIFRALSARPTGTLPLLLMGVTPDTDRTLLATWSGGTVNGCNRVSGHAQLHYSIGHVAGFTDQLSDIEIPYPGESAFYLSLAQGAGAIEIARVGDFRQVEPIFIQLTSEHRRTFIATAVSGASNNISNAVGDDTVSAFSQIAPAMMFVKFSAGEKGWHVLHHYANLTIDDPSLREPYGFLNYEQLVAEMDKHNFHSTIAFIPWNYDRNDPSVVSLFRQRPDRLSISIHGDNHDHKEFTSYQSKALDVQVEALRQSLARMNEFQATTGIPYDKVMIFPHSIAPAKTLEALKTLNYLATVNSQNVPMDTTRPSGLLFDLRSITVSFGGIPSITRYSVAVPTPTYLLAVNDYLDNPLLFYCHHEFFQNGSDAFNNLADRVNELEPSTRWRGLGDIIQNLYLVKKRDDSTYDVQAWSATINLENPAERDTILHIAKLETGSPAIASVTVDGVGYPFQVNNGQLIVNLPIAAGRHRKVTIKYEEPRDSTLVSIKKNSVRVYLLRMASEFRDNILYRSSAGRALIAVVGDQEVGSSVSKKLTLALMSLLLCVAWSVRLLTKRHGRG